MQRQGKIRRPQGKKHNNLSLEEMIQWFLRESAERLKDLDRHKSRQLNSRNRAGR